MSSIEKTMLITSIIKILKLCIDLIDLIMR